jgi:hypothetical protein
MWDGSHMRPSASYATVILRRPPLSLYSRVLLCITQGWSAGIRGTESSRGQCRHTRGWLIAGRRGTSGYGRWTSATEPLPWCCVTGWRRWAEDAESWARSEVSEGIPQQVRFLILRRLWRDAVDAWAAPDALDRLPAAKRLLDAGADRNDLVRVGRAAASEAVVTAVATIEEGHDPEAPKDCPGWLLMETGPDDNPTGREV